MQFSQLKTKTHQECRVFQPAEALIGENGFS